jgi:hypothetical protein
MIFLDGCSKSAAAAVHPIALLLAAIRAPARTRSAEGSRHFAIGRLL